MKKETLFKIIAISLPFFLVLLAEVILRLGGYGEKYLPFRKVTIEGRPGYLEMNPSIAKKYFKHKGFNSDNQFDIFLREKTDSTFRIFVQGASTVVGFPYYRSGSFPRMLKHRLSQTFPEKNIEVVNMGITAVNSYTLWDLAEDIVKQQPDLIIIYAGHNEYYGALGVGSTHSISAHPALVRTYLSLKQSRFFQLLDNSYSALVSGDSQNPKLRETTLMEVMTREQRIPLNSNVYHAGLNQFENNLEKILHKYKKNKIPVILSTLVSNEKDIKPFISDDLDSENSFMKLLESESSEAHQLARENALAAYTLGRHYLEKNLDTASKYLHLAKELDLLRFRAPEQINKIIIDLSEKHDFPLVDMKDVFLTHSADHAIIGNELMTEHVHPNIRGYFLMADAFYEKIRELNLLNDWDNYIPFEEAVQDIPVTGIDSIRGEFVIDDLKKSWPYDLSKAGARVQKKNYRPNATYEEKEAMDLYNHTASWKEIMVRAYYKYDKEGSYQQALRAAQSLILEYPEEGKLYRLAGEMCLKLNEAKKANYYFSKYNQLRAQ